MPDGLQAHLLAQAEDPTRLFWHRLRWRFVSEHLPPGPHRVLDVGAGAGVLGHFLARHRPDVTYLFDEPIAELRARLRAHFGDHADHHEVDPSPDVDVVTLLDVLEHVADDRGFLSRVADRVRPGTRIIVTVPASMRLWSEWDTVLGHHRRYEPDTLAALVDAVGLEAVETGRLFPELVPAAWWRARRRTGSVGRHPAGSSEFPDLPGPVNVALELLGRPGVRWRTRMPTGTSLCALLRVPGGGVA